MISVDFLKWAGLGFMTVLIVYIAFTRSLHALQAGNSSLGWSYALVGAGLVVYLGYRLGK